MSVHLGPEASSIRVFPELRAVQVERTLIMTPATTWYFDTNFDLRGTEIPQSFVRVSLLKAVGLLVMSRAEVLEVPEPLWVRFLPKTFVLGLVWRLSGFLRFKNRRARTYAIENNDLVRVIFGDRPAARPLQVALKFFIGAVTRLLFERIAFGTPGAAKTYGDLPFVRGIPSKVIVELPTAQTDAALASPTASTAVFVGQLDLRKGVVDLMQSWEAVERSRPDAHLSIIGAGQLEADVRNWVENNPISRSFLGQLPHHAVSTTISSATVLIAPSRRAGRWREQIGLPIEEALAQGLTIVASSETGLADWLEERGHFVFPTEKSATCLSAMILQALHFPLNREDVLASLPSTDGRILADRWIHASIS